MPKLSKALSGNHLLVQALAGTGKTTTLCWAVQGVPSSVKLSPEQEPIVAWVQNLLSKFKKQPTIRFTAFSKIIAKELQARLPSVDCSTNHSLGLRTLKANVSGKVQIDGRKTWKICEDLRGSVQKAKKSDKKQLIDLYKSVTAIVSICKLTLTDFEDPKAIARTCSFYSVDCDLGSVSLASEVLAQSAERTNWIDFDDMVWLPAYHGFLPEIADIGIVDECQDLNAAQLWLVSNSCRNLIVIGDSNQSIFGFAGADPQAMDRILSWMTEDSVEQKSTEPTILPLNQTRRCSKKVAEYASCIVPDFKAHEDNEEGLVQELVLELPDLVTNLRERFINAQETVVLCRTNAPLTRLAIKLLSTETPVYIRGRKFAESIISQIKKFKTNDVSELLNLLDDFTNIEVTKLQKSNRPDADQKIVDLRDRQDVITVFSEGCSTVDCIIEKFDVLFSDENKKNAICLSSVHKFKGLEADTVFIFKPELLPHKKIAEKSDFNFTQETNLAYVGYSRAKTNLYLVREPDTK